MKPRRPMLNIEMFEDRLLPSSFALIGDSSDYLLTQTVPNEVISLHRNTAAIPTDGTQSVTSISIFHQNYTEYNQISVTDTSETIFPVWSGFSNEVNRYVVEFSDSGSAVSIVTLQLTFTNGLVGYGLDGSIVLNGILTLQPAQQDPGFNHLGQLPTSDPLDGPVAVDPGGLKEPVSAPTDLKSVTTTDAETSSTTSSSDPVAASPTIPGILLVSNMQQSLANISSVYAQPPGTDSHLLSEMTLAAVSLPSMPGMPVTQPLVAANITSLNALNVPSRVLTPTSVNVTATSPTRFAQENSDPTTTQTPVEMTAPAGPTLPGVIGLDEESLNERVSQVLSSVSALGAEFTSELEKPEGYTWLVAAGLLSIGAGYTAWTNRKAQRLARISIDRRSLGFWEGVL